MNGEKRYPSYTTVWVWLIGLLVVGLAFTHVPLGKSFVVSCIFAIAALKAFLVARHYMHLRSEPLLIYALAGVPVLLVIGMALALVPDIVFNR